MRFLAGIYILAGLFVLLQMGRSAEESEMTEASDLKDFRLLFSSYGRLDKLKYGELLLKKFVHQFTEYYIRITGLFKCSSINGTGDVDAIILQTMKCVKMSLDISESHIIDVVTTTSAFQKCFFDANHEATEFMKTIDFKVNYCQYNNTNMTVLMDLKKSLLTTINININDGRGIEENNVLCQMEDVDDTHAEALDLAEMNPGNFEGMQVNGTDVTGETPEDKMTKRRQEIPMRDGEKQKNNTPDIVFGQLPYY